MNSYSILFFHWYSLLPFLTFQSGSLCCYPKPRKLEAFIIHGFTQFQELQKVQTNLNYYSQSESIIISQFLNFSFLLSLYIQNPQPPPLFYTNDDIDKLKQKNILIRLSSSTASDKSQFIQV